MNDVYEKFRKSTNFDEHAEAILAHLDKQYKQDEITYFLFASPCLWRVKHCQI